VLWPVFTMLAGCLQDSVVLNLSILRLPGEKCFSFLSKGSCSQTIQLRLGHAVFKAIELHDRVPVTDPHEYRPQQPDPLPAGFLDGSGNGKSNLSRRITSENSSSNAGLSLRCARPQGEIAFRRGSARSARGGVDSLLKSSMNLPASSKVGEGWTPRECQEHLPRPA